MSDMQQERKDPAWDIPQSSFMGQQAAQQQQEPIVTITPGHQAAAPTPAKSPDVHNQDAPAEEASGLSKGTMKSSLDQSINHAWGVDEYQRDLMNKYFDKDKCYAREGSLHLRTKDGHEITWHQTQHGESISFTPGLRNFMFRQNDADAIVATAMSRGWENIAVSGNIHCRDMIWLSAQRMGLDVANHIPLPDSKVWEELKKSHPEKYEELKNPKKEETESKFVGEPIASIDKVEPTAAPKATKEDLLQWVDKKIASSNNYAESVGLNQFRDAITSGKLKLDSLEEKALMSQYKPRQNAATGVMEADGRGYNRLAEFVEAKGVKMPQIPEAFFDNAPAAAAPSALKQSAPKL